MAALLVRDAARFDVVVTTNMFGDILSDEAVEISGSLGLAGSINSNATHCMAQAIHGSAPDIAGKGIANPTSLILSAAMLLNWLAIHRNSNACRMASQQIEAALEAVFAEPESRTRDLGGPLGMKDFTAAICARLAR